MGAPAEAGGGDADLDVLVTAAEELGKSLAPAPVVEHQVAARIMASLAPAHPDLVDVVTGSIVTAFALQPAVQGTARLVPGGEVASMVVALDGDELVAVTGDPPADPPVTLASAPVADRGLDTPGRVVLATGSAAHAAHARAADEWRILTAASLVGLATGALDLAVAYVKERTQFGVPIGSFQAIQHGLAEIPGQIDGGRLLVDEAAWCLITGQRPPPVPTDRRWRPWRSSSSVRWLVTPRRPASNTTAGTATPRSTTHSSSTAGPEDGRWCWATRPMSSAAWLTRCSIPKRSADMEFSTSPEVEAFGKEVRALLTEHFTDAQRRAMHVSGTFHNWDLHRAMAERGRLGAGLPGGDGSRDPFELSTLFAELERADAPYHGLSTDHDRGRRDSHSAGEPLKAKVLPEIRR